MIVLRYTTKLHEARKIGIRKGLVTGLSTGIFIMVLFCFYGLAFWYSVTLLFSGSLPEASNILISFHALLMGAFALDQVSYCKIGGDAVKLWDIYPHNLTASTPNI